MTPYVSIVHSYPKQQFVSDVQEFNLEAVPQQPIINNPKPGNKSPISINLFETKSVSSNASDANVDSAGPMNTSVTQYLDQSLNDFKHCENFNKF